jgi:hypothetical protein
MSIPFWSWLKQTFRKAKIARISPPSTTPLV